MCSLADHPSPPPESGCLYIHIPFCDAKCGYCDFYSVPVEKRDAKSLILSLECELRQRLGTCPFEIKTVFLGGGTPTILPNRLLAGLLQAVQDAIPMGKVVEFTVEANPATIDDVKAGLLANGGVTRVSMGAQSFDAAELATLERRHCPDDIASSVETLRRHGIRRISLDLIFGIPGQTLDSWSTSLRRTIELDPDHVACYGLTYEPGTPLAELVRRGVVEPCGEHLEADLYLDAIDTLSGAGFEHYETSNFARPGCRCRHNLIYWRNGPYIGIGPSAAGYIDGRRYKNVSDVDEYIRLIDAQGHAEDESEIIDSPMLVTEMIMMQLRLIEGLSIAAFRERTGFDPVALFGDALDRLATLGLLTVSDTHIALTRRGRLVSDPVMADLAAAAGEHLDGSTQV